MLGLGAPELIVILLVALVIFGPKKLPEMGKSLGQGIREFRRSTAGIKEELESSFREDGTSKTAPSAPAAQSVVVAPTPDVKDADKNAQA